MHERNIFKDNRPNFDQLAAEYPEFKKYLQVSAAGKSYLCFKDPASLRALSTVLLKKHFQISLDLPLDRLIPTIPLRLNYIHWLEDLVGLEKTNVHGIDIGCGASCVYGLLGHRMNQWNFVATELDEVSFHYATKNVEQNNALDSIKVLKVSSNSQLLSPAIELSGRELLDFTMCNPPFFDEVTDDVGKNRTSHRPPPASVSTASDSESYTTGGELQFVQTMIDESLKLQNRVRWFTSMLGKKSSLNSLKKLLKNKKIFHTWTTFQQGKTLRWGLAWSFIETSLQFSPEKKEKKAKAFEVCVQEDYVKKLSLIGDNKCVTLYNIIKYIEQEFKRLELKSENDIEHITLGNHDSFEMIASAFKNTWIHQRKKRREERRLKQEQEKLSCEKVEGIINYSTNKSSTDNISQANSECISLKRKHTEEDQQHSKKIKTEDDCSTDDSIFNISCSVSTRKGKSEVEYIITFLCLKGNKDQCHQLCLYINNFLKQEKS